MDFRDLKLLAVNLHSIVAFLRDAPLSSTDRTHVMESVWAIFYEIETLWSELVIGAEDAPKLHLNDDVMSVQRELVEMFFELKKEMI
jgi:hypothetical protein